MLAERWPEEPEPCPGTMITGLHPLQPPDGVQEGVVEELGGPHDGVSGEMGAKPGEEELGGPHDGVSGEMGAKPGEEVESGGPQDGVSGEMGAKPGELLSEVVSAESDTCAALTFSGAERERFNPSLSIYMSFPFYFIA